MGWGEMGERHVLSLSFLNFGLRGSLVERRGLSMGFFSLSLIMGGATMGEHVHILFFQN
jgi:hypothetical protein